MFENPNFTSLSTEPVKKREIFLKSPLDNQQNSISSMISTTIDKLSLSTTTSRHIKDYNNNNNIKTINTEPTKEQLTDIKMIRLRDALNPKRFYKKEKLLVDPKTVQIGTIMDSPLDRYSRISNKSRKQTIVDMVLEDIRQTDYAKKKFKELQDKKFHNHTKGHSYLRSQRNKHKTIGGNDKFKKNKR